MQQELVEWEREEQEAKAKQEQELALEQFSEAGALDVVREKSTPERVRCYRFLFL